VEEVKSVTFLGLLFSAGSCPPCKFFLSMLKDFYSDVNIDMKALEILFISLDKTEEEFKEHYATMPWLALPYRDERIAKLKEKFKVVGIPILVVVDSVTGFPITTRGRKDIHE
jgi:nucleoredoxin